MRYLNLGFIGFGLIGGSIVRALRKRGADISVTVYSRRKNPDLDTALSEGVIDDIVYILDESFSDCDIVFLCAPVQTNIDLLKKVGDITSDECIITDVSSTKSEICLSAKSLGLSARFIGGHPMAGSEKTGYINSTDTLLENAYYLLTPSDDNRKSDIELMRELVTLTGAQCVMLPPKKHDDITAAISHVPHIIAASLVNLIRAHDDDEQNMKIFAAGGFKDITRIASSSPVMWQDICLSNSESIDALLSDYVDLIEDFREYIKKADKNAIYTAFDKAGEYRNSIPSKSSSLLSRSYKLYVNIDDRAGAIATIATVLSVNSISIKNIGIIHNREFEDGVLCIELYSGDDMDASKELLIKNRYEIVKRN